MSSISQMGRDSLVPQVVKNSPANAGTIDSIPGSGRSLENKMATHCNSLLWKIPWTKETGGYRP